MITAGATPTPKTIDQRRVALTSPQVKTLQTDNAGTLGAPHPRRARPGTELPARAASHLPDAGPAPVVPGPVRLHFWMRLSALLHRERHRLQGGPGLLVASVDPTQDRLAGEIGRAFFGGFLDVDHAYVTDKGVVHDVIPVLFLPDRGVGG